MNSEPIWVTGATRSGKTAELVGRFGEWVRGVGEWGSGGVGEQPGVLVLAAIGENRMELVDRLTAATQGKYPFYATTPLGFFQDEVMLFYPLLVQELDLRAQFPLRLAPENEQELATRLWKPELDRAIAAQSSLNEARLVRRVLDLMQLAGLAGVEIAEIPAVLDQGWVGQEQELPIASETVGMLLDQWRSWCLDRGFLTYGILAGLYWQHLLPNRAYQNHLAQRFRLLLADDVDEYPAIARPLFEVLLQSGTEAVFTYNPNGAVRLGLGADPDYLGQVGDRSRKLDLNPTSRACLGDELEEPIVQLVTDPLYFASLPESVQAIQTISRSQLLRRTAELIIEGVRSGQVQPRDVAVIAPGMDAIARYSLTEILTQHQIPTESLNDQRPLTSSPIVRALLTLMALVYPGLGRLVDRDAVAEMLVVLSRSWGARGQGGGGAEGQGGEELFYLPPDLESETGILTPQPPSPLAPLPLPSQIDPARAGLLADYCFAPHPDRPRLLAAATFPRWDRLGYQATTAYQGVVEWIEQQQTQLEQRLIPNGVVLLDRAIQTFLMGGTSLPFDQLAALRQLIETAQQYWEVSTRLRQSDRAELPPSLVVSRFIQLLRSGTVTANPFPVRPIGRAANAVTLANVFQYRASRRSHAWQFWMDAGSTRWLTGVDALWGAPLFLRQRSRLAWTAADAMDANDQRLQRILRDLLGRSGEQVFLCYSDLATSGQEQTGILLSLVNAAIPIPI